MPILPVERETEKRAIGRIYVVDDDWVTKDLIVNLLVDGGWRVVGSSCDSEEATKAIPSLDVDVAILDIRFPRGRDGIGVAAALQERSDTEVIFVTAHNDDETCNAAQLLNPVGYLDKPINSLEELGPLMAVAVQRRRRRQEFMACNKERLDLIELRAHETLTQEQEMRLQELQRSTTAFLDEFHAPDTSVVDRILGNARDALP